jgi:hypothetical protein
MALNDVFQLDPTSGTNNSNSNFAGAGIEENGRPSDLNNAMRALGSMVARAICYQSAAISASVSTNIAAASTGLMMSVLGAGNIASFGLVPGEQPDAAVLRFLEFSSSASLSHGTALRLIGGQSRRTQPGDIGGYLHVGSADVWHEFLYSRADGALAAGSISVTTITNRSMSTSAVSTVTLSAASMSVTNIAFTSLDATSISASVAAFTSLNVAGVTVQTVIATYTTVTSTTDAIPLDDSIPQQTEGLEIISQAFTPKFASSTILIDVTISFGAGTGVSCCGAIFKDATANAVRAGGTGGLSSDLGSFGLKYSEAAGSATARTYKLRVGPESGTMFLNQTSASDTLGSRQACTMVITEIAG